MIEKLLNLVPADVTIPLTVLYASIAAGFVLWLIGAKLSRSLFTLASVALGCAVGRRLPGYFNWQIDGMATAVGGAVVMGVLGYSLHRLWVAMALGMMMATWGALAVWIVRGSSDPFSWPPLSDPFTPIGYAKDLWLSLPGDVAHLLPLVCGTLYVAGFAFAVLWHRAGTTLLHSLLGATLLILAGLVLMQTRYSEYLNRLPHRPLVQCAIIAAVVLIGIKVQSMLTWRKKVVATIEPVEAPPAED